MNEYETPLILPLGSKDDRPAAVCTWIAWVLVAVYAAAATVAGIAVAAAVVAGAVFWST
ncbi:MAG: hypothetical protein JSV84_13915 [Gemmatimonadota bacterium]|nr:MAG: hypothetical protein JSV84_13915 [Gemmatimonadota bacterium]